MRRYLREKRNIMNEENREYANPSEDGSNIGGSSNTRDVLKFPSPTSKRVSDRRTSIASNPEVIGEYGVPGETESPVDAESRISTRAAQIPPFEVPTRRFPLSSGFPYHRQLFHYRISPDEWSRFTDDVTRASSLSTLAQWAVWGTGVTVGVTSSTVLTIFGIPPGYYAGKAVYNKAVERKVRQGLKEEGEIEAIMKFWNETVFMKKGCKVRLGLPSQKKDRGNLSDSTSDIGSTEEPTKTGTAGNAKDKNKKDKKTRRFFKLIVEPLKEEDLSSPLLVFPGLDRLKEAALREVTNQSTNRSTMCSDPSVSPGEPPAYAPSTFVPELEAVSAETAVESGSREIREMPGSTKIVND